MDVKGEKLYEVELDSGEVLIVQRLSPFARIALLDEAARLYPMPDPTPFQQPIPNAAPGVNLMTLPEDNPQYRELVEEINRKRNNYFYEGVIVTSAVDCVGGKEAAITKYAEQLTAIRQRVKLDGLYTNWQATVLFCIVRVPTDTDKIVRVAGNAFALQEEEIRDGIRCFRNPLQR